MDDRVFRVQAGGAEAVVGVVVIRIRRPHLFDRDNIGRVVLGEQFVLREPPRLDDLLRGVHFLLLGLLGVQAHFSRQYQRDECHDAQGPFHVSSPEQM